MKKITLNILAALSVLTAVCVSCSKDEVTMENPLTSSSFVIVPDNSDGTIDNFKVVEVEDDNWKIVLGFDVKVTPAKYAEELANSNDYNFKATFSQVEMKSAIGDAFTISPNKVTYNEGSDAPYLTLDFELEPSVAEALMWEEYAVSAAVENKDGSQAVASAFVPLNDDMLSFDDYDYYDYEDVGEGYVNITNETVIRYSDEQKAEGCGPMLYADGEEKNFELDGEVPYSDVWVSTRASIRDPWANGSATLPLSDWMSRIGGQTLLKYMTIPGTHDSATGHIWSSPKVGQTWAMTQTETISEQLRIGVRCFDIRLYGESLDACHGIVSTGITFDEILEKHIFPFLNEHSSEGVILILKHEERNAFLAMTSKKNQMKHYTWGINRIAENVKKRKAGYERILLNPDLNSLKMDDIRGKVAILFRDIVSYQNIGDNIIIGEYVSEAIAAHSGNAWRGDNRFSRIVNLSRPIVIFPFIYKIEYNKGDDYGRYYVQDEFEYDSWTEKYYVDVEGCFKQSVGDRADYFIFNHTSGYRKGNKCGYGENANLLNRHTATYLRTHEGHGVVMMDYAGIKSVKISGLRETWDVYGDDLCTTCVEHNFYGSQKELYTYQTKD